VEARYRRADGEWRWLRSESQPRWDPTGKHMASSASPRRHGGETGGDRPSQLNEVLERRIAERTSQLESSEARCARSLETSNQYQLLLNQQARWFTQKTALAASALRRLKSFGRPFWETPWFSDTDGMREIVHDAFAAILKGEAVRTEMQLRLPIGSRYFDFTCDRCSISVAA